MSSNRLSADYEKKLTRAIEKAATLTTSDETRDKSKTLADCLLEADIDSKFAKRASEAFNRRSTVLRFQNLDDEGKIASFPLADDQEVLRYMGGVVPMAKAASAGTSVVKEEFRIVVFRGDEGMAKTASEERTPSRVKYEDRVPFDIMEQHLESMLQKQAAAFEDRLREYNKLSASVRDQKTEVANMLKKASAFEFQTMCNLYGEKLEELMGQAIPERKFTKTASAVDPETVLSRKIAKLISDNDDFVAANNTLCDYSEGLQEFSKSASNFVAGFKKSAGALNDFVRSSAGIGLATSKMLDTMGRAEADSYARAMSDAIALNHAGTDNSVAPGKVLDAKFLINDRFNDRMMAWSDMSAEPAFALYPAEQVFMATQKAMDTHPELERPDRREVLRAQVGVLLAQNNREGREDIKALSELMKAYKDYDAAQVNDLAGRISLMDKEKAPAIPSLNGLGDILKQPSLQENKDWGAWADNKKEDKEKDSKGNRNNNNNQNQNQGGSGNQGNGGGGTGGGNGGGGNNGGQQGGGTQSNSQNNNQNQNQGSNQNNNANQSQGNGKRDEDFYQGFSMKYDNVSDWYDAFLHAIEKGQVGADEAVDTLTDRQLDLIYDRTGMDKEDLRITAKAAEPKQINP